MPFISRHDQDTYGILDDGNVTLNGTPNPQNVQGLLEQGENGASRGLTFAQNFDQFGWWSCVIKYEDDPDLLHVGTFKINEKNGFPQDIRLPDNNIEVSFAIEITYPLT